jgi:tRNA A37 N6-isopentenylltransferase MiaA
MVPKRQSPKEVSPIIAPVYNLEKVSRPWYREKKELQAEDNNPPELRRQNWVTRKVSAANIHSRPPERRVRTLEICRGPPSRSTN